MMRLRRCLFAQFLLLSVCATSSAAQELEVMHWWTSESERAALNQLRSDLAAMNVQWQDAAIEGGAGESAIKILNASLIANKTPHAAQLVGYNIEEWARLNKFVSLNQAAAEQDWHNKLPSFVEQHIIYQDQYVAVPFAIHHINQLYLNQHIYQQLNLTPPMTWKAFLAQLEQIKGAGYVPIAHSDQPWQIATLFESILLSVSDAEYFHAVFVQPTSDAISDKKLITALKRLRQLKPYMGHTLHNRDWNKASEMLLKNHAAIQIMGDWAKGELNAFGFEANKQFDCIVFPDTQGKHIYSVDSFVFFKEAELANQIAKHVMSDAFQLNFSRLKGSIPVVKELAISSLDSCAQNSHQQLVEAQENKQLVPSLVHRMANRDEVRNVFLYHLQQYFLDDGLSAKQTQQNLLSGLANFIHE